MLHVGARRSDRYREELFDIGDASSAAPGCHHGSGECAAEQDQQANQLAEPASLPPQPFGPEQWNQEQGQGEWSHLASDGRRRFFGDLCCLDRQRYGLNTGGAGDRRGAEGGR